MAFPEFGHERHLQTDAYGGYNPQLKADRNPVR
jgi:hypothetical protein